MAKSKKLNPDEDMPMKNGKKKMPMRPEDMPMNQKSKGKKKKK